ncbi:LysR substrate-binding domain-containing protein [Rhizobium sp.]|jgi:LysR family transcriptional regulator, glycine cleavage system transcriptional activator|uniref:LysR substrate-binding domain-containing protein n=1 Tax=Rhizobium sp. TaxID=391 RepID=UPI000E905816|nr:LysR family transcriptional regulator [Rhizobium sp.]
MKMSKQFPLNALRVFEAVARHGSFTRASEELGMTQTAVSYQIKLLEDNIGEALFLRQTRQIALTETGERLLPKTREGFELLREAVALARQTAEDVLEIHSTPTFASHWLARHLGKFQLKYPHIAVRLQRSKNGRDLNRESGDVAIYISAKPLPGLACDPILNLNYTPMLSPALAASIGGIHEPADLLKLPWISAGDDWPMEWLTAAGVTSPGKITNQFNAFGALDLQAGAAIAGHGIAMLSSFYVAEDLLTGRLIQPFDVFVSDGETYWLTYPTSRRNTSKIKAFHQWLKEELPPLTHDAA